VELAQQAVARGHLRLPKVQQERQVGLPRVHGREDLRWPGSACFNGLLRPPLSGATGPQPCPHARRRRATFISWS
jgi:hypothetical protein